MSSMASTTVSRAAAAEARHGLRHEAADTAIAELKRRSCGSCSAKSRTKCFALGVFVCAICNTEYLV